jgi:hypothetical protein
VGVDWPFDVAVHEHMPDNLVVIAMSDNKAFTVMIYRGDDGQPRVPIGRGDANL